MVKLEVGKPFPGAFPKSEGCLLEITADGSLICFIQLPGLSRAEQQAFKKSFKDYGYLETGTTPPIAMWIWNFQKPLSPMDVNFNAALVDPQTIDKYFELIDGQMKNMVMFYLLDGPILSGIKMVGLDLEAVKLFRNTIEKQRQSQYSNFEYNRALDAIYSFTTEELYDMSVKFKK